MVVPENGSGGCLKQYDAFKARVKKQGRDPAECKVFILGHRFQNPCEGMRNARLKREDAFSQAIVIVSSAMVSSS